jgi:hypothetical protein
MERENLSLRCKEKTSSERQRKRESIEVQHRITHFVDKANGRNYIMVVNKSLQTIKQFSFKIS